MLAEIRSILETSRHDRPLQRGPFLALLGDVPVEKKPKPASKVPRPMVAKPVKPVRKRVQAKCYDRDLKYLPREQTDPTLHPISAGFRTIALSIGGGRKPPG